MLRIIDLSHPITDGMPVYPGDPEVHFKLVHAIRESGYNVSEFCMGAHSGTHVDTPHHCMHTDRAVQSISLDSVVGWAEVLDLGELPAGYDITAADLDRYADRVQTGARVLLRTGWSKRFHEANFFTEFPGVTQGAVAWLNARKVRLLGLEQPSVHTEDHLQVHKLLLSEGVVLVETLTNLDKIMQERVFLVALPPNLVGLEGAPMRVVAIEGLEEHR